jgi:hypothetical protein
MERQLGINNLQRSLFQSHHAMNGKSSVHKYMTGIIILASVVLLLAGCKDSDDHRGDHRGTDPL